MKLFYYAGLSLLSMSTFSAEITCDIEYADTATSLKIESSYDPYQFASTEPGGNFRFSAQYLAESKKLKTFVYHDSKDRYVLIHASENTLDETKCTTNGLGLNKVYSAAIERELIYQCRQICPVNSPK
jgi:hypothetical protein